MKRLLPLLLWLLLLPLVATAQNPAIVLRSGTVDPPNCTPSGANVFFNTGSGLLKVCTAVNTWSAVAGGGGPVSNPVTTAQGGLGADNSASSGVPLFTTGSVAMTGTTGTGNFVRATSATITTPIINTPAINGGTNAAIFTSSGYSLTGSNATNSIDIAGTWNTTGVPTFIKANVTNTASGTGSLLFDLQVGAVSKFNVNKFGYTTVVANSSADYGLTVSLNQVRNTLFNRTDTLFDGDEMGFDFGWGGTPVAGIRARRDAGVGYRQRFYTSNNSAVFNTTPVLELFPGNTITVAGPITSGTVSTTTGGLKLANSASANLTTIQAGNAVAARTYTWPTDFGSAGAVLTDAAGDGTLSWAVGGGGGGVTSVSGMSPIVSSGGTTPAISFDFTVANTFTASQSFNVTATDSVSTTMTSTSSTTNQSVDVLALRWLPTGTAGAGGGPNIRFAGKSTTTASRPMGYIQSIWTDATDATRTADMVFQTTLNGTAAERARITSAGVVNVVTGFQIGGVAASRKMLVGNGTNFVASTETWAAPGTSGNVLTSDGTNWTSAAPSGGGAGLGANTFTDTQTITQATANHAILVSTGYSLTGSNATSAIDLAGTWNTSGAPTAFKLNITDTASNVNSLLFDLQLNASTVFRVLKSGKTEAPMFNVGGAGVAFTGIDARAGGDTLDLNVNGTRIIELTSDPALRAMSTVPFGWTSSATVAAGMTTGISRISDGVVGIGTGAVGSFAGDLVLRNIKMGATTARGTTEGTNALSLFNGTAPVGTLANGGSIYSSGGELFVIDAGGTATQISPHDSDGNWIFNSTDTKTGKRLKIDVEKLLRFLNDRFGTDFIHEYTK